MTTDAQITLLANMITLTPGTLSVDVSADRKTLYVHAIDSDPVDGNPFNLEYYFEFVSEPGDFPTRIFEEDAVITTNTP